MSYGRAYRSFEEFTREELRPHERLDMSFEEILAEFDVDEAYNRRRHPRQGLFDGYDDEERCEDYDV